MPQERESDWQVERKEKDDREREKEKSDSNEGIERIRALCILVQWFDKVEREVSFSRK